MRDPAILLLVCGLGAATFLRPWIGVLALAVVGYMHPQGYAWGSMSQLPAYKIIAFCLVASILLSRDTRNVVFLKQRLGILRDWRLILLGLLWLDFLLTSYFSLVQVVAWNRFLEISKVFFALSFTLLLIDTRRKLNILVAAIALSIALLAMKGGVWAVLTGSMDRVYGPPHSDFYDNNHFAVLVVMNIPLLHLWLLQSGERWLKGVIAVLIALSVVAALTSWSRGALLSLSVTAVLIAWHSRKRILVLPLILMGLLIAVGSLPEGWFERMGTLATYQDDGSASGRLGVWNEGLRFALQRPWVGAGPDGWFYVASQDWHSAYVEVLAEHGFPGLVLWLSMLLGTIISLTRLAWLGGKNPETDWVVDFSSMLRTSLVAYAVGAAFLGLSYWDILYHLVVISALLSYLAREQIEKLRGAQTQ